MDNHMLLMINYQKKQTFLRKADPFPTTFSTKVGKQTKKEKADHSNTRANVLTAPERKRH